MNRLFRPLFVVFLLFSLIQSGFASPAAQNDCPAPRLVVGEQGRVLPGNPNRLRDQPNTSGAQVGQIPGGSSFDVLDGPICAEGYNWWQVDYDGTVGYTVEGSGSDHFVEPVTAEPEPQIESTATPSEASDGACPADVAPEPRLVPSTFGVVSADTPIRMRAEPSTSAEQITTINPAFEFVVLDGPTCAEGYNWWHIEDEGTEGWIAEGADGDYFVAPVAATPTPTASRTPFPTSIPTNTRTPTVTFTPSATPTSTVTPTQTPTMLNRPRSVSWSADGALVAVASDDGALLYDPADFAADPHVLQRGAYALLKFSPTDPTLLVAVPFYGGAEVWNVEEMERVTRLDTYGGYSLAFSADGAYFAIAVDNGIKVYDTETWELAGEVYSELGTPRAALSVDGALLAYSTRVSGTIELVLSSLDDLDTYEILDRDVIHEFPTDIAFSTDGQYIIVGDGHANLQMWNLETMERTSFIRSDEGYSASRQILALAFDPSATRLVTAEGNPQGIVRVFDARTLEQVDTFGVNTDDTLVQSLAFNPDGTQLAIVVDDTIRILDTETYEEVTSLILHP